MAITVCECGCIEFITTPNQYDLYEIFEGKLEFRRALSVDEETILYCRDCSKEYKLSDFDEA
jgi:hypothetical protein